MKHGMHEKPKKDKKKVAGKTTKREIAKKQVDRNALKEVEAEKKRREKFKKIGKRMKKLVGGK